jgi:5-deoxy-5-amino-3-dehydroquinate synthase
MNVVPVELGARRYEVAVGDDVRKALPALLEAATAGDGSSGSLRGSALRPRRVAVVTQDALSRQSWFADIDTGVPSSVHLVPEGEVGKTPEAVSRLCRAFAVDGLSRADVVVAVGGGMVTDLAGFAAATYLRGIRYVNVATSLLGQVDAAVGGKTGVNLPEGKNLVGAFWQPLLVLCDTATLATLPPREWNSGRGEIAKCVFLGGREPDVGLLDLPIDEQVARCVALKAQVVAADEHESGRRAILNYGHTLAHALEAWALSDQGRQGQTDRVDLRHGEAVAVGLIFAACLARRLGRIDDERVEVHRRVVQRLGLPTDLPSGPDGETILSYMRRDKKAHHDLTFVLDGPDGVETVRGVVPGEVLATLKEMGAAVDVPPT